MFPSKTIRCHQMVIGVFRGTERSQRPLVVSGVLPPSTENPHERVPILRRRGRHPDRTDPIARTVFRMNRLTKDEPTYRRCIDSPNCVRTSRPHQRDRGVADYRRFFVDGSMRISSPGLRRFGSGYLRSQLDSFVSTALGVSAFGVLTLARARAPAITYFP